MNNPTQALKSGLLEGLKDYSGTAIGIGILVLLFGLLAIASPLTSGVGVMFAVGLCLVIAGAGQCFLAFRAGAFGRGLLIFLVGLVTVLAGAYLVTQPLAALASITLLLAIYFVVTGLLAITTGFQLKPANGWGLMLANGVVTLALGWMLWRQWPVSGAWAVGILFGAQLVMTGVSLIAVGSAVRSAARRVGD